MIKQQCRNCRYGGNVEVSTLSPADSLECVIQSARTARMLCQPTPASANPAAPLLAFCLNKGRQCLLNSRIAGSDITLAGTTSGTRQCQIRQGPLAGRPAPMVLRPLVVIRVLGGNCLTSIVLTILETPPPTESDGPNAARSVVPHV